MIVPTPDFADADTEEAAGWGARGEGTVSQRGKRRAVADGGSKISGAGDAPTCAGGSLRLFL